MAGANMVQSLVRGMDIVKMVAESPDGLRLIDIAEALEVKTPTAHNLCKTLVYTGALERMGQDRYFIGALIDELSRARSKSSFANVVDETMQRIAREEPQVTATFALFENHTVRVTTRISPDKAGVLQRPEHQCYSIYASASGLAALVFASGVDQKVMLNQLPFYEYGAALWGEWEKFESFMQQVAELGYARLPFPEPFLRVAAPVFAGSGELRGVLGVSLMAEDSISKKAEESLIQLVTEKAVALSNA